MALLKQFVIVMLLISLCAFPLYRTQGAMNIRGPIYFQSPYVGLYYYMYHQPEHRIANFAAREQCRRAHHGELIGLNEAIRQQLLATMATFSGGRRDVWIGAWNGDRYNNQCLSLNAAGAVQSKCS
jgi:hypothetical protein